MMQLEEEMCNKANGCLNAIITKDKLVKMCWHHTNQLGFMGVESTSDSSHTSSDLQWH